MKKKTILLKAISLILALTFAMFAFASCNSEETPQGNTDTPNTQTPGDGDPSGTPPADDTNQDPSSGTVVSYTLNGADGKSGYQLALEAGFTGTVNEYLDTFKDTEDAEKAADLKELFNTKHQLRVDENGDFKVLVLSDAQCSSLSGLEAETAGNIKTIVEREMPDLVIFNGDNCYGLNTKRAFKQYVEVMAGPCEDNKIPWAHVYGNHDDEVSQWYSAITKEEQQEIYESFDYCVSKAGEEELFGMANYVLPVFTNDGSKIAFNVWALDSGAYVDNPLPDKTFPDGNYFLGKYEYIQENQINWYMESSKLMEAFNGENVTSMMTFHIPLQEVYTAWTQRISLGLEWDGEKRDNISPCTVNCGLFDKLVERGDVKLVVNSHDHLNDFSVKYKGVRFAYTACIGTEVYHADDMLGGRVINYSTATPDDFETHMSYVIERTPADPSEKNKNILELVIESDGTVMNGVDGGETVISHNYSGSVKEVKKNNDLNKDVIAFEGTENNPSVYNIAATPAIMSNLTDGFSYEVKFMLTDASFSTPYVGVLDFEESGGFGLDIYKSSDSNKAVIHADLAYGSTWSTLEYTINLNEWYHVVFSYDGTNAVLYINGQKVASATLNEAMRLPTFASRAGEEYICIGACAQAWGSDGKRTTGIRGFTGELAIANIFANPVTAEEATALYNASK